MFFNYKIFEKKLIFFITNEKKLITIFFCFFITKI